MNKDIEIKDIVSIENLRDLKGLDSKDIKFWLTVGIIVFSAAIKIIDETEKRNPPKEN